MSSIFTLWRSSARRKLKKAGPPVSQRLPLRVESLERRLTPAVDIFFNPRAVVAVNPQPLPPGAYAQFDPHIGLTEMLSPGPTQTSDLLFHLQGTALVVTTDGLVLTKMGYQLDGQVHLTVVPPGVTGGPAIISASFSAMGSIDMDLLPPRSPDNSFHPTTVIQAGILMVGNASALGSSGGDMNGPVNGTFSVMTSLQGTEVDTIAMQSWMVMGTVTTTIHFSENYQEHGPCKESLSVQDVVHETWAPMTPAGYGPATTMDAVFTGSGNLTELPSYPSPLPGDIIAILIGHLSVEGQLQETIAPPAPSPTTAPPTETFTFNLKIHDQFDEVISVNPT